MDISFTLIVVIWLISTARPRLKEDGQNLVRCEGKGVEEKGMDVSFVDVLMMRSGRQFLGFYLTSRFPATNVGIIENKKAEEDGLMTWPLQRCFTNGLWYLDNQSLAFNLISLFNQPNYACVYDSSSLATLFLPINTIFY